MRQIKGGTLNVSIVIRIVDSTDGTPETGVVAATAGLAFNYRREGAAAVAAAAVPEHRAQRGGEGMATPGTKSQEMMT